MFNKRFVEIAVGLFMIMGLLALFMLAFQVSNFSQYSSKDTFKVTAVFDNIGDLKIRAPVTIAGVRVGEVSSIVLNAKSLKAEVTLFIDKKQDKLPNDTAAKILTAGLIGANYISLVPGYSDEMLKNGDTLAETHPALILEDLIGQFIYKLDSDKKKEEKNHAK